MPGPSTHSRKALALLETLGCEPTPKAYAVAYAYVESPDGPLAIDMLAVISRRRRLGEADVGRLHASYIETGKAAFDETAVILGRQIGATMEAVGEGIASARFATSRMEGIAAGEAGIGDVLRDILEAQGGLWERLRKTNEELEAMRSRYDSIVEEARLDPLTQLSNRRAYDEHVARDVARSSRSGEPLSLVVVDIDHFKSINDTYGHSTGDQVIRLIGKTLRGCVRTGDMTARLGGEEYAVILPGTDVVKAAEVAERIRATIEGFKPMAGADGASGRKVTVSMGVASYRAGDDPDSLFRRADACLYAAKREGRNRIVSEGRPGDDHDGPAQAAPSP